MTHDPFAKELPVRRNHLTTVLAALVLAASATAALAQAEDEDAKDDLTPEQQIALCRKLLPSMVLVEYTVQYDKSEAPGGGGYPDSPQEVIAQERPMEVPAFLVSPTLAVAADPLIHPRFVKKIQVRHGQEVVDAEAAAFPTAQVAVLYKLAKPLASAKPLEFKPDCKGPYQGVSFIRDEATWTLTLGPAPARVAVAEDGYTYQQGGQRVLVIDKQGTPVGVCMIGELPVDGSWKGNPGDWPAVSADRMAQHLDALQKLSDGNVLRVKLHFRSPKKDGGSGGMSSYGRGESSETEMNTWGLLADPRTVLVLATLEQKTTARLERIEVFPPQGATVEAKFAGTLKDYGALLGKLDSDLASKPVAFSSGDVRQYRCKLLTSLTVELKGEERVPYLLRDWISGFSKGWKGRVYLGGRYGGSENFLFDDQMRLVALPIARREKVAVRERYSYYGSSARGTPAAYVKEVLDNLADQLDPNNVPLTEEEEARLAWLGVEMQAMDFDLARANNVSDLTNNGQTGAMVSWVYAGSPAAKAGVQPGWILLRLHVPDQPKPVDVRLEDRGQYLERFPWDRLDEVPEQYYEDIPRPFPPVENSFTRALTDLGFGKTYKAEFVHDGKTELKEFTIDLSPPHYDTAPKYKNEDLGLTVRDLTYEARRYFQKKPDDPAVIVSKIETGSKASVAGLKPYELITHVNDQPVLTVGDFEKLVADASGELRLSVKRMAKGRIVKVKVGPKASTTQPEAAAPGAAKPAEPAGKAVD